ncbi:MAG: glycosyltransferase [Bacteroidetes bacterium]|uniref:Glycosyltransferase n=1 Tax=Candidatus Enterocola intestinipullorum TaxID=2840783 RepID=A0A9D9HA42_9BACT|nr:glycosyltransferase [Candidatus Enterocola intestinipullorum]
MQNHLISIITINYNNAEGLNKTLASVNCQTSDEFEHIIVDGGSTDNSVDIIKRYENDRISRTWISEKDSGIYNAMNKGIRMAHGQYVQFLNSGDYLVDKYVISRMSDALRRKDYPDILYGNIIVITKKGRLSRNKGVQGKYVTPWMMYQGAIPHSSAYIKRELFDRYGMYDENMKIVSDWEWYFEVTYYHGIHPKHEDTDVSCFNSDGISETNHELNAKERRQVIERIMPPQVLPDYDRWKTLLLKQTAINRHPFAVKFQNALLCIINIAEKIQLRRNSRKLKREFKKKGIEIV